VLKHFLLNSILTSHGWPRKISEDSNGTYILYSNLYDLPSLSELSERMMRGRLIFYYPAIALVTLWVHSVSACNLWKRFALLRRNIIIPITNGRCKNNKWSNNAVTAFWTCVYRGEKTAGRDDSARAAFKNRHGSTSAAMHFVLLWCPPMMLTITPVGFIGQSREK